MIIKVIGKGEGDYNYLEASFIFSGSCIEAYAFIHSYYHGYDNLHIETYDESNWHNNEDHYGFDLSIYDGYPMSKDRAYGMEYSVSKDEEGYKTEYFSGRQPRISDYI